MGFRLVQGILLLCLAACATSLVFCSCNREPEPTAIDISQPTQSQPPVELWRKRVVTKPPSKAKRSKLEQSRDSEQLEKVMGWTLDRSPVLLASGNILCVTKNKWIEAGNAISQDIAKTKGDGDYVYRLIVVSNEGKITLHKEFTWDISARITPDPTGEYLAFVPRNVIKTVGESNEGLSPEVTISVLDNELNIAREFSANSAGMVLGSFSVSDNALIWQSRVDLENTAANETAYSSGVFSMERRGSINWEYQLPDGDSTSNKALYSSIPFNNDGNVLLCHSDKIVYALNANGEEIWNKHLDYSFKTHPAALPDGKLVLVGDKSHNVIFLDPDALSKAFEEAGIEDKADPSVGELISTQVVVMREMLNYQLEILKLPGYLFVLSSVGETLEEKKLPAFPLSGPLVINDSCFLLNVAGKIDIQPDTNPYEVDIPSRLMCITTEGEILWDIAFETGFVEGGIQVVDQPEGAGKCIVAAGSDGNLYCLDEAGELLWVITGTAIDPASLAVGTDGRMYVVDAGELVCYQMEGKV